MSKNEMKRILLIMCFLFFTLQINAQQYVDLGLPSHTKWSTFNVAGTYEYFDAKSAFGENLPGKTQWEELRRYCQWILEGNGYTVTGPNGKSIFLPIYNDVFGSHYWIYDFFDYTYSIHLSYNDVSIEYSNCSSKYYVRLVQKSR